MYIVSNMKACFTDLLLLPYFRNSFSSFHLFISIVHVFIYSYLVAEKQKTKANAMTQIDEPIIP